MKIEFLLCTLAAALTAGGFTITKTFAAGNAALTPARGRVLQRLADKLDLTTDQRTQIRSVLAGERDSLAPLLSALHDARKNLRTAIRAAEADEASVHAASAKVAAAEADLAVERMKLYGKIAPILADAQRQQLGRLQQRVDGFANFVIAHIGSGLGD